MGIVSASIQYSRIFIIGKSELAKLFQLAAAIRSPVEITVFTRDQRTYYFSELDDLLALSNGRKSRIFSIEFRAAKGEQVFNVDLDKSLGISARIRGEREFVEHQTILLRELSDSCRPWYSFAFKVPRPLLAILAVALVGAYYLTAPMHDGQPSATGKPFVDAFGPSLPTILISASWFCNFLLVVRDLLFPETAFLIGDGVKRMNTITGLRSLLLVSVLLALIVNIISSKF